MDTLFTFFDSLRVRDVVDILLNSYILFRLYALFRGTHVFRILMGIAILWFLQRLAVSSGLVLTSWVVQGITAVAALIIIVVFRNEIRSVLQARNLKAFFWGFPRGIDGTPVEALVEGIHDMSERRIGGLIVFPGKEDLDEVIHSGIPWQGLPTKEMLVSIFWHDNPVHDGAAIVQGNRITEVSAVLPLSHRKDLPSHYGTRHRAAAGLAEVTDALVVIVSEERGTVAMAKGSSMKPVRGKEALTKILQDHLGMSEKVKGRLLKEKLELSIAALVSVLFISGVWFSFTSGLDTLITLDIPIEYLNRSPTMEILDASAKAVRLDLSGSGALIRSLRSDQVKVRFDLSNAFVGENTFNITRKNISIPPGVVLKNIKPQLVEVTLDNLVKKALPVQVDWTGKLPRNLRIVEAKLTPERVLLIGSNRILKDVTTVYTELVSVDNIRESGTMTVKIALNPAALKLAPETKESVSVQVTVQKRMR